MQHSTTTSLSDIPFKENVDDLGTKRYINGLTEFIKNSDAPLTIALQGEWGSGKTSLMNKLFNNLCGTDKPFIGVNVNTWEFSMLSTPEMTIVRILEYIIDSIAKNNFDLKSKVYKILLGVGSLAFGLSTEAVKFAGSETVGKVFERLAVKTTSSEPHSNITYSISDLRKEIGKAIDHSIKQSNDKDNKNHPKKGVIIFVDDLDRLNPPVAVEILELLKNVFTLDKCIFVLAIDYDVVVKGLEPKFGKFTNENEREFRSFFDKIIQVPFSLPVSSYRPNNFILKSLTKIGFLKEIDTENPEIERRFSPVVAASVGKNPRSIKRLINTLSLLECIDHSGSTVDYSVDTKENMSPFDEKLLRFIIVAIQISYPRIYRLLVANSAFTAWDMKFALKEGIKVAHPQNEELEWSDILEEACAPDPYLKQHTSDIIELLTLILETLERADITTSESIGMELKKILDKSSVTGVNAGFKIEEFDTKDLIRKLHGNVEKRLNLSRPDINDYKFMNNTGNGGIRIWYDGDGPLEVNFYPNITESNRISFRLRLRLRLPRPDRMKRMNFDEIMQDERLAKSLKELDSELSKLLTSKWYFEGQTFQGQDSYFRSYIDELRYIHNKGWLSDEIANDLQYWINLKNPSSFEDNDTVDTITRVITAYYDFRKSMKNWK